MNPAVILEVIQSLGTLKDALGAVSGVASQIGQIAAPFQQLQNVLTGVVGAVQPFVEALAPSVVAEFRASIRDFQATVGQAFVPLVQVVSSVTREISGVLMPLLQQLTPIVSAAANAIGTLFVSAVRLLVVPLEALTPVLDLVVGFMSEYAKLLSDEIEILTALAKVGADMLKSLFGTDTSGLKEIFRGLADIIRQVIRALVTFAATLTVAFGAAGLVAKFADALGKEAADRDARAGGLKAAGTNPQIGDIAGLLRQAQLSAFTAQGGATGREKTDTEYLKALSDDLKKIAGDGRPLSETLTTWWRDQVMGGVFGQIQKVVFSVFSYFDRIKERVGRFFGA